MGYSILGILSHIADGPTTILLPGVLDGPDQQHDH